MPQHSSTALAGLAKLCIPAVFAAGVGLLSWAERADATGGPTMQCSDIDPTIGGIPFVNTNTLTIRLTVVDGNRIEAVDTATFVTFAPPPGGPPTTTPSPAVFPINAGNAGNWFFDPAGIGTLTLSCTVAPVEEEPPVMADPAGPTGPTPGDKSIMTDNLFGPFNQLGGAIFDPEGVPGMIVGGGSGGPGDVFATTPFALAPAPHVATQNPMDQVFGYSSNFYGAGPVAHPAGEENINFSVDMRSLIAAARDKQEFGNPGSIKDDGFASHSPWNTWVSGRYVSFDDDQVNADRDGRLWWITSGVSYRISEKTTIGTFSRLRRGKTTSVAFDAELESEFYGGGAFYVGDFFGGIRLLGGVLYETSESDIRIGTATGSFDSDQWTVEARINRRVTYGRYWVDPAVKVLYTNLERDSYTDSTGALVPGSDITLGRLTFGPMIGTAIVMRGATLQPFVRINGIWDFESQNAVTLSNGVVVSTSDTALNLGGGGEIAFANGLIVTAAGDWFNFDGDLQGWSFTGGIGAPLSLLGLGGISPVGYVSLDLAAREHDSSAKMRIRIPLGQTD